MSKLDLIDRIDRLENALRWLIRYQLHPVMDSEQKERAIEDILNTKKKRP